MQPSVETFAPGVVTVPGESLYRGRFSPDGDRFYFFRKVTPGEEDYRIFVTRRTATGGWGEAERVEVGGEHSDLYPTLSPDGTTLVFASYRPPPSGPTGQANLWYARRDGDGWDEPVYMDEASDPRAYNPGPTFDPDGWLRYKREVWGPRPERDHLRVPVAADGFGPPERDPLLDPFQDWREDVRLWEGTLSPDGSLLILGVSELHPVTGQATPSDLWVTRREEDGWSEPVALSGAVNSPGWETFVTFTPDGRYRLFGRGSTTYHIVPVADLPEGQGQVG